jgi:putative endonuclease
MYTVYILKNLNSHYYIGFTSDVERRLKYHNTGKNKSTRNKGPWTIVYKENFEEKKLAWFREKQIKSYKGGEAFKKLVILEGSDSGSFQRF